MSPLRCFKVKEGYDIGMLAVPCFPHLVCCMNEIHGSTYETINRGLSLVTSPQLALFATCLPCACFCPATFPRYFSAIASFRLLYSSPSLTNCFFQSFLSDEISPTLMYRVPSFNFFFAIPSLQCLPCKFFLLCKPHAALTNTQCHSDGSPPDHLHRKSFWETIKEVVPKQTDYPYT